jgi:ATP-dependent Clp endopeptidase proteolytic subunit ClpP
MCSGLTTFSFDGVGLSKAIKNELALWHEYDILPGDHCIYMGSHGDDGYDETGVDYSMAERTIKNLHILDKRVHEQGITIKMNNVGGDIYHGLAIYDAIKACQNDVKIIVYGHAMSMGSFILQAADERIMSPMSRMMIHYGQGGIHGHMKDVYRHADELKELDKMINGIYLSKIKESKPRFTMKKLEEAMNFDWFLSPEQAVKHGLCDRILE